MKRTLCKLLPAFCLLLLAGTALAGGVVVSLDGDVPQAQAGTPFDVNFSIFSAHDGSPQDGFWPIVQATNSETGETITARAESAGPGGHYTASLTLPTAGTWQWKIQPEAGYLEELIAPLTPLEVSAPSAAIAARPAGAATVAGLPLGLWAIVAVLALVAVVAVYTGRRLPLRA